MTEPELNALVKYLGRGPALDVCSLLAPGDFTPDARAAYVRLREEEHAQGMIDTRKAAVKALEGR